MTDNTKIDYNQPVLEVENLKQHFKVGLGKNKLLVKAVDGISFNVYKREVFGIVGESGCGKTTAGRTIMRLYNPTNGIVKLNGKIIGAGYGDIQEKINFLRKARKEEIINHNNHTKFYYEKDQILLAKIKQTLFDIYSLKEKFFRKTQEITAEQDKYDTIVFELTNQYKIAQQKNASIYKLKTKELLNKTFNVYEKEYKRLNRQTLSSLKMKLKGVRDSSALSRDTKKSLYESIKLEYDAKLKKLREEYEPKINDYQQTIIDKKDIKALLDDTKASYIEMNQALKNDFDVQIAELEKPKEKVLLRIFTAFFKSFGMRLKLLFLLAKYTLYRILPTKSNLIRLYRKFAYRYPTPEFIEQYIVYDNNLLEIKKIKKLISEEKRKNKKLESPDLSQLEELEKKLQDFVTKNREIHLSLKKNRNQDLNSNKLSYHTNKENTKKHYNNEIKILKQEIKRIKKEHNAKNIKGESRNMQMIFQDPIASLNPRMTVREIIAEGLIVNGVKDKNEITERVLESMKLVGLSSDYLTRYPHEFSGGQRQRIGIARALIMKPNLIIADEPVSALDVSIQAQVINLLRELKEDLGLTIVFVAHDLSVVKFFCDRIAVMYYGKIVELASSDELFKNPLHPYTKALLSAIPQPDPEYEKNRQRIYYSPTVHDYSVEEPVLTEIKEGHFVLANSKELAEMKKEIK